MKHLRIEPYTKEVVKGIVRLLIEGVKNHLAKIDLMVRKTNTPMVKECQMKLSHDEIKTRLKEWNLAWDKHDLDKVMDLFHEDVFFENWTGAYVKGKKNLRKVWTSWFENHGNFRFLEAETFVDEQVQKVLYRWVLEWPSMEPGFEDRQEIRKGVDVIHFKDGKIINKLTFSKTTLEIDNKRYAMHL